MKYKSIAVLLIFFVFRYSAYGQDKSVNEITGLPDTTLTLFSIKIESEKDWLNIGRLKRLTQLTIDCKNISALSPELKKLDRLTFLWLTNADKLNVAQASSIISGLPVLEHLTIENIIWQKTAATINLPASLRRIEFWNGDIPVFPAALYQVEALESLKIRNCKLKNISNDITGLKNLRELDLSFNSIEKLPVVIWSLTQLESFTSSTPPPPEIGKLVQLKKLSFYGDKIRKLPPEIKNLTNLTRLYISCDKMDSLPPEIAALKNLQALEISCSELKFIPSELFSLQNIIQLSVSSKKLMVIPPEIAQLNNLRYLKLDFDFIKLVQPFVFKGLNKLSELTLNGIVLDSIFPEISSLTQLRSVDLSYCSIAEFPSELTKLKHLKKLNLTGNYLINFQPDTTSLKELEELNLSNNTIENISTEIGSLTSLKELILSNNKNLKTIPGSICRLNNLEKLDIRNTSVTLLSCPDKLQQNKLHITR